MKKKDWFIVVSLQTIITLIILQCKVWLSKEAIVADVEPVDALTIWAAVITIVFLVFSVMGLMNIDRKLDEIEKIKLKQEEKFNEMQIKAETFVKEADQTKQGIVTAAEQQISKIVDDSTTRINFFNRLISTIQDPFIDRKIMGFTDMLRETKHIEGIDFAYIYMNRGNAYLDIGKEKEAYSDFETAIRVCQEVNKASAYSCMGTYYASIKDYQNSIDYYKKALEYNPQSAPLYMDIGNSLAAMKKYDEADSYFLKALSYNPEMAEIFYNKAVKLKDETGAAEKEQCMAYLNKCIEINPMFIKAYINKAALYQEEKKYNDAVSVLDKVIAPLYSEDFLRSVMQRGINSRMIDNLPEALNDFIFVSIFLPNNIQNLLNMASSYLNMTFFREAQYYATKGLKQAEIQQNHLYDEELRSILGIIESQFRPVIKIPDNPELKK